MIITSIPKLEHCTIFWQEMENHKLKLQDKYDYFKLKAKRKLNGKCHTLKMLDILGQTIESSKKNTLLSLDELREDANLLKSVDAFIKKAFNQLHNSQGSITLMQSAPRENQRSKRNAQTNEPSKVSKSVQKHDIQKLPSHNEISMTTENWNNLEDQRKITVKHSLNSNVNQKNENDTLKKCIIEEQISSQENRSGSQSSMKQLPKLPTTCTIEKDSLKKVSLVQPKSQILSTHIEQTSELDNDGKMECHPKNISPGEIQNKNSESESFHLHSKVLSLNNTDPILQDNVSSEKGSIIYQQKNLSKDHKFAEKDSLEIVASDSSQCNIRKVQNLNYCETGNEKYSYQTPENWNITSFGNEPGRNLEVPLICYNSAIMTNIYSPEKMNGIQNSYASCIMNGHPCYSLAQLPSQNYFDWDINLSQNPYYQQLSNEHFMLPYDENTALWGQTWIPAWNEQATLSANQFKTTIENETTKIYHENNHSKTYFAPAETILHSRPAMPTNVGFTASSSRLMIQPQGHNN